MAKVESLKKLSCSAQPLNIRIARRALRVWLRFGQANDFAAFFPLAALLEQLDPLETLQNVAFRNDRAGSSKAAVLRHKLGNERKN